MSSLLSAVLEHIRQKNPLHGKKPETRVRGQPSSYLEIGGRRGPSLREAMNQLVTDAFFDLVDISATSIRFAKKMVDETRVKFYAQDFFAFRSDRLYDLIAMGEVMEHGEDSDVLLKVLHGLLADEGHAHVTAPANVPAIDHIPLFRIAGETREIIIRAGFQIIEETHMYSEDAPPERAESLEIPSVFRTLIRKSA